MFQRIRHTWSLWIILLALAQSAIMCIFQAAVYLYARDGVLPPGFDPEALGGAGAVQAAA